MTILIDNFSIGVEEWLPVTDLIAFSVDVVDLSYPISTSGTYFLHDGTVVPTVLSGILNGYRAYYAPISVASSGTITITIHAENTNSGIREQNYYLLYGYHVEFNELIDWGPKSTVVTSVKASNLAFCPNTEGEAVYFETRDLESYNLGASILPIESVDLGATIYPQSTFFFYGRTYTITVSGVKDFGGNELEPVVFSFTIENPTD
jgi:hypothetical protein